MKNILDPARAIKSPPSKVCADRAPRGVGASIVLRHRPTSSLANAPTIARATRQPVSGWGRIEADEIRDSRMSPTGFRLLCLLLAQAKGRPYAVLSVAQMAAELDRSRRMVQMALRELEGLRYVTVVADDSLAVGRRFYLRWDVSRAAC